MKTTTLALAGAIALLGAGASLAQQPPGPPPGPRPGPMMQRPDPARMAERHAQHLRDALQLTPAQEPALRAFVEASRPPMDRMERMHAEHMRDGDRPLTTPERLDRMRARMAEHQAQFERRADAIKRFYAQLSPAQQKAFDAMGPMGGRGRGGPGMRMHGMHGPDGPGGPGGPRPGPEHDHHD